MIMARYNTDGSLDSTFNGDGRALWQAGWRDRAVDVAMAPGGKIVVTGQVCDTGGPKCMTWIARFDEDGNDYDDTFHANDPVIIDVNDQDNGTAGGLAVTSSGKIVVGAKLWNGTDVDFVIYRFTADGTMDSSFGSSGMKQISFGAGRGDVLFDLFLQGDKIVAVGETCDPSVTNCNFAIARLTSSGRLDKTFSGDGKQTVNFGGEDIGMAGAPAPNGKIVIAGTSSTTSAFRMAVARLNPDGTMDATFSGDGKRTVAAGDMAGANDVVVQGDGKIILAGCSSSGPDMNFIAVRLKPGGGLDSGFSGDGRARISFTGSECANALVRQANGKYVLGGMASTSGQSDFALARVLP
jgi:uncharacterized delta-60 repeat protein